jgi:spermidine/putrescine transport system ATP-binding protein
VGEIDTKGRTSAQPQIELRGVSKRYGTAPVVDRVDLSVEKGQFFSLLGPSGCGKSTILKMIAGFDEPTEGEIVVAGRSMAGIPPEKRNIGFVFQNYALFPHLSVAENVAFGLQARGAARTDIRNRVAEMLELVELGAFADRRPSQLSGGQQQRVALARALAIRPDVLLLDEPFGALDRRLRQAMQEKVVELQRRVGVTTIFVTHDQEEALTMSDRIAVMSVERHGFEQIGNPREIYEKPSTARVSTFIGQTNLWEETVASVDPGNVAQTRRGLRFRGDLVLEAGQTVIMSLRPERILLLSPDVEVAPGATVFSGHVRDTHFLGEIILSVFEADNGMSLRVKQLNSETSLLLESGARAQVSWTADALRVLNA